MNKSLNYKAPLEDILEKFNDKFVINKIYKLQEIVNFYISRNLRLQLTSLSHSRNNSA